MKTKWIKRVFYSAGTVFLFWSAYLLAGHYYLQDVTFIAKGDIDKFKAIKINTSLDLLNSGATRKGRLQIAQKTKIAVNLILAYVQQCDFLRIKGIGPKVAVLLKHAGIMELNQLRQANPKQLAFKIKAVNKRFKITEKDVVEMNLIDWIDQAKKLPDLVKP